MKIKKMFLWHRVLFCAVSVFMVIIVLYLMFAIYTSFTLNSIIERAFNDEPYNLNYIINENNYKILNPRQPECEQGVDVKTEWSAVFPFVLPFITDAYFKYSYIVTDKNTDEVVYGSLDSHVTVKLDYTSFPCYICDVEKSP